MIDTVQTKLKLFPVPNPNVHDMDELQTPWVMNSPALSWLYKENKQQTASASA
jgi:uncharacterized membrane protein YkgB